jgi:diguanylate cyclase (GGDEF)-like protein/PAS domain S-box-containing protein
MVKISTSAQHLIRGALWALPGALALWATAVVLDPVRRMDHLFYDFLVVAAPAVSQQTTNAAVVVAIDERSMRMVGRWPWPRRIHADLLENIGRAVPGVIAYDVLFDAPDTYDQQGDAEFAHAIADSGRVILPVSPMTRSPAGGRDSALLPFGPFKSAAAGLAHVDVEVDADAVARRLSLRAGDARWPALALAALDFVASSAPDVRTGSAGSRPVGEASSSVWRRAQAVLLENARIAEIPRVSAADVLDNVDAVHTALAGKAVFVGVTAAGVDSMLGLAKSMGGTLVPAVVFHAEAYEALRAGATAAPMGQIGVVLLSAALLLLGSWVNRQVEPRSPQLGLAVVLLPASCSALLLFLGGIWFPPVAATLALAVSSLLTLVFSYRSVRADRFRLGQRTGVALDAVADGVLTVGLAGDIQQANPVAAELFGYTEGQLRGRTLNSIFGANSGVKDAFDRCMLEGRGIHVVEPVSLTGQRHRIVRIVMGPLFGPSGQPEGAVLALSDVTEAVAASERLAHQATHDALTGLPNRVLICDRLERAVAQVQRAGGSVAVLFVDLDRFKRINDGLGHQMGDLVLIGMAGRLHAACRVADTIGRWGGDEFIIILSDPRPDARADLVAQKIIEVISEPLVIENRIFHLGASIGISIAPDNSSDPEALLDMADMAMYQVKLAGGGSFGHVSADMTTRCRERMEVETDLRDALAKRELVLHYQPQFDLRTGLISGMEALIRWQRPGHGLVSPANFMPVAEDSSLIFPIGAWVLDETARQVREWMDRGYRPVTVAANVSARQCVDSGLESVVADVLARHAIPPRLLEIEITETAAVGDVEHVASLLAKVHKMGVHIALDDFGTGYSSLSHLKRLSIGTLKIDRSFISGAPDNEDDTAISRATISLAHNLGMRVVAEGVETEAQRVFLLDEGCDVAQGYLFSRPLSAITVAALLSARRSDQTVPSTAPSEIH